MTKRTNPATESQPTHRDVAIIFERVERILSEVALIAILVICFAYSFTHTAALFREKLSISGVWPNLLATCVELAFFAFGAEYRRRVAAAARSNLKFREGGLGLPMFAMVSGLALVAWSNLDSVFSQDDRPTEVGNVLAALVAPGFASLVLLLFETRRRRTRKAARSVTKPLPKPEPAPVPKPAVQAAQPAPPAEQPPAREALTPPDGELKKEDLAALDALAWFEEHKAWPKAADLMRKGHSDGSARRGLSKARQDHYHMHAVGE